MYQSYALEELYRPLNTVLKRCPDEYKYFVQFMMDKYQRNKISVDLTWKSAKSLWETRNKQSHAEKGYHAAKRGDYEEATFWYFMHQTYVLNQSCLNNRCLIKQYIFMDDAAGQCPKEY